MFSVLLMSLPGFADGSTMVDVVELVDLSRVSAHDGLHTRRDAARFDFVTYVLLCDRKITDGQHFPLGVGVCGGYIQVGEDVVY